MAGEPVHVQEQSALVPPVLTLVIPLFNEEEALPHLKEALDTVLEREKIPAQILFVNDGSSDGSAAIINSFADEDNRVQVHHFKRNRGKSDALDLGFRLARGKYIITMDADLQDDPEEIPRLIAKLEDGYDLVSGWKRKRHDPLNKTFPSKVFNWMARVTSGVKLHDFNCGLKIYRREVVETLRVYGELHRFIPILAHSQGWRVGELAVNHHPRKWGVTKYGFTRFLKGMLDLLSVTFLTRFTFSPMYLFGSIGMVSTLVGLAVLIYLSVGWFMGVWIGNRPLFFLGILLMIVGIQFFSLGLISELISHMRMNMQLQLRAGKDEEQTKQ